ncbi:MAG: nicotinamide mononucleotide transporter [Pyrinomonadaceae bacterium]
MQFYGIDWLATVCGLTGVYLLGNKNKYGFLAFVFASASWITFGVMTGSMAVIIGSSIFLIMHLRGWVSWRREERGASFDTQHVSIGK